jgi:hypothetical protein
MKRLGTIRSNRDNCGPPNPETSKEKDMPREKNPTTTPARKRAPRKTLSITKTEGSYTQFVGPEQRAALIAEAAYFRAEKRGFSPGNETEDWLAAEAEVDARLLQGAAAPPVRRG